MKSIQEILPIKAIRVVSCGKDWVSDTDTTITVDKLRGFSMDDWGVHLYSAEMDIHGEYDDVNVPFSNLGALVFYFNELKWEVSPLLENAQTKIEGGKT